MYRYIKDKPLTLILILINLIYMINKINKFLNVIYLIKYIALKNLIWTKL